ncbi:LuxR C-terminal-related transcriptional regulator [Lentzea sp. HUAS12]|uniref:LuxR C-terminal-related transcriptional regulator n=1 Tax=Lentzea sp. HUAS12 TaxID=2951806 RepID=UPI0020A03730|nr:LuxR C-terminal-related transcriptional regulator [Lentzea sp. HUAS12]USX52704.1 LuxR C-terminal-related transcriptional regulator [Lentzea sp. HUAS12]
MSRWSADPGHDCAAVVASGLLAAGQDWAGAVQAAERALVTPVCRADPLCVSRALGTLVCAGELVAADTHSLALLEQHADDRVMAECVLLARACVARHTGDLARCSSLLVTVWRKGMADEIRSVALLWEVELLVARGEPEAAEAVLLDQDADAMITAGHPGRPLALAAKAVVAMATDRPREALETHLTCGRALAELGVLNPGVLQWRSHASRAALACGDADEALRLAMEEHAAAARWGEPRVLGWSLSAVARASAPTGEDLMTYERAIRLLEMANARMELAEVLCDYADRLAAHGRQVAACESYALARATALDIGAAVLVRRADEVVGCDGMPVGPVLTPVEAEVARLVREGLPTREIGAKLAMATRTVELHLTRVYRKLGLAGRRELQATRWTGTLRTHRGVTGGYSG